MGNETGIPSWRSFIKCSALIYHPLFHKYYLKSDVNERKIQMDPVVMHQWLNGGNPSGINSPILQASLAIPTWLVR